MSHSEYVASHIWMSHVAHINESCRKYEWVMSHIWMSHVAHMNESCRTYEWVAPHMRKSRVTHVDESCRTCEWVMSHIFMSRITLVDGSCHTCEEVMCDMTNMNYSQIVDVCCGTWTSPNYLWHEVFHTTQTQMCDINYSPPHAWLSARPNHSCMFPHR